MPEITLYPHQEQFLTRLSKSLVQNQAVIGCSPGGTGKTKCFITIARRTNAKGRTTLIVTDRIKVFNQIRDEANGIVIDSKVKHCYIESAKLYVCMAQSMSNRPGIVAQFNQLATPPLVIVDECHTSTANRLLTALTQKLLIGFTATPHVRWAKHLPLMYNDCVVSEQIDWFIQNGWLCSYQHIERQKPGFDTLKKKGGEYTEESQGKYFGTSELYTGLIEDLRLYSFNKCMVFCSSIKAAEETYTMLQDAGFAVSIVHSKRADESYQMGMFRQLNQTNICVSVGSMTTGFDYPEVDQIMLYRATTSLPLYLQMLFRANRKKPSMFFRVFDYGRNGSRHLLYYADRDWETLWKEDTKRGGKMEGEGIAAVKVCKKCEALVNASIRICPYCDEPFPISKKELEEGILVDLTEKYNLLLGRKISTFTPEELANYANLKNKKGFAKLVAKAHEQDEPGWLAAFGKALGYKKGWETHQNVPSEKIEYNDVVIKA